MVVSIQTFGEFLKNFHPHLHTLTADGLFTDSGTFTVMPTDTDLKPLEELFRVRVIQMLLDQDLLPQERAGRLLSWRNSGFSVYAGHSLRPDQSLSLERTARYIIRNTFSLEKMLYHEEDNTVIYQCDKVHPQTKRDYEVFSIGEFIAAITQHIPEKRAQMVRYYGWYSNRSRGKRRLAQEALQSPSDDLEVIDVSDYSPKPVPTKKWRELIAKVWEVDPLLCPRCGSVMFIRALTDDPSQVKQLLKALDLYDALLPGEAPARSPPKSQQSDLTLDLTESQIPLDELYLT